MLELGRINKIEIKKKAMKGGMVFSGGLSMYKLIWRKHEVIDG